MGLLLNVWANLSGSVGGPIQLKAPIQHEPKVRGTREYLIHLPLKETETNPIQKCKEEPWINSASTMADQGGIASDTQLFGLLSSLLHQVLLFS